VNVPWSFARQAVKIGLDPTTALPRLSKNSTSSEPMSPAEPLMSTFMLQRAGCFSMLQPGEVPN
jgi:hypothetical protein